MMNKIFLMLIMIVVHMLVHIKTCTESHLTDCWFYDFSGFFKTLFEPQFSSVSSIREMEEQAYSFFLRYTEECEGRVIAT